MHIEASFLKGNTKSIPLYDNQVNMIIKAAIFAYLSASAFLFFFPKYLHKAHNYALPLFQKALKGQTILNICHRGSPRKAAQNTIDSFSLASSVGDMLEMDVCSTKDGVLVVHHDLDLERTCGIDKKLKDVLSADLPKLQDHIQLQFAQENQKIETGNEPIPTLQEVLQKFPQMAMNIELKSNTQEVIAPFMRLLHQYKRTQNTIIGIRKENHEQLALLDQKCIRFCSDSQVVQIILAYFTGLLPFLPLKAHTLQVPLYTAHFFQWKRSEWRNPLKTYLFFGALRLMNVLMVPMIWHLRQRGVMTFYWVCNDKPQFARAIACGACGIITDEAQLLKKYLDRHLGKKDV